MVDASKGPQGRQGRAEGLWGTLLRAGGCGGDGANPRLGGEGERQPGRCSRSSLIRSLGAGGSAEMAPRVWHVGVGGGGVVARELPCFREEQRSPGGSSSTLRGASGLAAGLAACRQRGIRVC